MNRWLTVALQNVVEWPDAEFREVYDGYEFLLLPESERSPPAIALELKDGLKSEGALAGMRRFLSAHSWVTGHPVKDHFGVESAKPGAVGRNAGPVRTAKPWFRLDYLPSTQNPKARLCLALFREALGLNNEAYQFLAFFKIVNVLHKNGPAQKKWINATLPQLSDHEANERLNELGKIHGDLGKYLFESGRCAVAHAYAQPVVDPDNPTDTRRLSSDLPVIRAVAEYLLEHDLGIKSAQTVRREHLYQLAGFRKVFGPDLVAGLKKRERIKVSQFPAIPTFSIAVRNRLPYLRLAEINATISEVEDGCVAVDGVSSCGLFHLRLVLSFPDETLDMDVLNGISVDDDGTTHATLIAQDHHRLFSDLFLNGVLEIWRNDTQEVLARSNPIIPVNMRYDGEAFEAKRRALQREYLLRVAQA